MTMEFRPLDVTVLSAKGLPDVNLMSTMDVYVVVSISGDPRTAQRTPVDKDAGTSPKWNFPMKFTVDKATAGRLTLVFKIMSGRTLGDRDVGEVHVPMKELLDAVAGEGKKADDAPPPPERIMTFSVRTAKGKAKGTLEFSYRFGAKYTVAAPAPPPPQPAHTMKGGEEPVMAYPAMTHPASGSTGATHPPPAGYPQYSSPGGYSQYPPPGGYPHYPPAGGYPHYPSPGGYPQYPVGYPPQPGYGYPYGQAPAGYGGYPAGQHVKPPKKSGGSKMGLGLAGGLLGGLLIGDMIGDMGEMAAYDAGYDDAMDAGFDF